MLEISIEKIGEHKVPAFASSHQFAALRLRNRKKALNLPTCYAYSNDTKPAKRHSNFVNHYLPTDQATEDLQFYYINTITCGNPQNKQDDVLYISVVMTNCKCCYHNKSIRIVRQGQHGKVVIYLIVFPFPHISSWTWTSRHSGMVGFRVD